MTSTDRVEPPADGGALPAATAAWVDSLLDAGERVTGVRALQGGWTSRMLRLTVRGPGGTRELVLRSFVTEFFRRHADGLLRREADVLEQLAGTGVPAARLVGIDATPAYCDAPSLLMTLLPGRVRVDVAGADHRIDLLAAQLAAIHAVRPATRPRDYQAWADPDQVRLPTATTRRDVWDRAVDAIRPGAPPYRGSFLHRDFHPGNVLFAADGSAVTGVVDWVETSWGPADLDVAHCSTALALLYGVPAARRFTAAYQVAGGILAPAGQQRYWRLLDALAFAPDAQKVAEPWRDLGRTDLTPELLTTRLEDYLATVLGGSRFSGK